MHLNSILAEVQAVAEDISDRCGVPVDVQQSNDIRGRPVLWVAALPPEAGRVNLAYVGSGEDLRAAYAVGRGGATHPRRCSSKPHAMRVLLDEAIKVWRGIQHDMLAPPEEQPDAPTTPDAQEAPPSATPPHPPTVVTSPTYSAAEAVAHPAIRAAVIASHEIVMTTGTRPDPAMVCAMANAALAVVDVLWPHYAKPNDGPEFVEHLLIGTLSGALTAAQQRTT